MLARPVTTALSALLLALLAAPSPAQESVGRVKVQFPFAASMGVDGDAVEGLGLRLTHRETGETVEVVTGADGSFAFRDVEPGPYRLHLAPPAGTPPDEAISVAIPRAFRAEPRARAKKLREIVVVGLVEPGAEGPRKVPAHTPEWTDISDHDPGVAPAGGGHDDWIELVSLHATGDDGTLFLTIPPAAWKAAGAAAYVDLEVGVDRSAPGDPEGVAADCPGCGDLEANVVRGAVVFGDGIRGQRPPREKPAAPALRAAPAENR